MELDNTLNYWLEIKNFDEAESKVMTGNMKETTKTHLELLKHLEINKKDCVLDFGCGIGRLTKPLAEQCFEIVGADVSNNMINYATKYCTNKNTFFKNLKNEEGEGMPFDAFDKAFSLIVLQHLSKPKAFRVLYNIFKSLKIGGKMLIQYPCLEKNREMYSRKKDGKFVLQKVNPKAKQSEIAKKESNTIFRFLIKTEYYLRHHTPPRLKKEAIEYIKERIEVFKELFNKKDSTNSGKKVFFAPGKLFKTSRRESKGKSQGIDFIHHKKTEPKLLE